MEHLKRISTDVNKLVSRRKIKLRKNVSITYKGKLATKTDVIRSFQIDALLRVQMRINEAKVEREARQGAKIFARGVREK